MTRVCVDKTRAGTAGDYNDDDDEREEPKRQVNAICRERGTCPGGGGGGDYPARISHMTLVRPVRRRPSLLLLLL